MSPLDRSATEEYEYIRRFGHITLYLDDIDDLISHLNGKVKKVELQALNAVATDGAADLISARKAELRDLKIVAYSPGLKVVLTYQEAFASTNSKSPRARDLVDDIASIVAYRRRPYIFTKGEAYQASLLATFGASIGYFLTTTGVVLGLTGYLYVGSALIATLFSQGVQSKKRGRVKIKLKWIKDARDPDGFKNRMLFAVVAAVISALIAVAFPLISALLGKVLHPPCRCAGSRSLNCLVTHKTSRSPITIPRSHSGSSNWASRS